MALYLVQLSYTTEAWAALVKNPQDRSEHVGGVVKKLGGKMENFWLAFGDHDVIGLVEMPDMTSAAAFSIALSAGGACKSVKTTPLMSLADAQQAMKKAATSGYKPASAKRK